MPRYNVGYGDVFWVPVEKGPADFLEIFSGSCHASNAFAQCGYSVGPPIDLNTGYDLLTSEGRKHAWDVIEATQPSFVLLAPPCTAFS